MIVGLDVDGVLANFIKPYEDLFVEVTGKDLFPQRWPSLPPVWDWPQHFGYSDEDVKVVWAKIKSDRNFWGWLPAMPGAEWFLRDLMKTTHEVYFITDRPGVNPKGQTSQWLTVMAGYFQPTVIISRRGKGLIAHALSLDVYIDDKPENVEDVMKLSPSTHVYMPRYPYNERLHRLSTAVDSLEEFAERAKLF